MSFAFRVKNELNSLQIKSNCCKKAYILGAMLAAQEQDGKLLLKLTDPSTAEKLCLLLKTVYRIQPEVKTVKRGCYQATEITFESAKLADFLCFADSFSDSDEDAEALNAHFGCQGCRALFLRGAFCAKGTVNDPKKGYSFEIPLPGDTRAMLLHSVMEEIGPEAPGITARKGTWGVFYKNESAIEYILSVCGAAHTLYDFMNASIEKNLRNNENRATNCDLHNIKKSVNAAKLQLDAIEAIMASAMDSELSEDLRITAALRIEYPSASLGELAEMHLPAISKSGLNHRLQRLVEFAKQRKLI